MEYQKVVVAKGVPKQSQKVRKGYERTPIPAHLPVHNLLNLKNKIQ